MSLGNWAKAIPERYSRLNLVISYYVNRSGLLYININGEELAEPFVSGISVNSSLWALIDIYGNATAVEFLGESRVPTPLSAS